MLARLGAFSPLSTIATFSPGAQALLRQAERTGELALHLVRAVWWTIVMVATFDWFGISATGQLIGIAQVAVLWAVGLLGLRSRRFFTVTRFALVVVDAWLVLGFTVLLAGPFASWMRDVAAQFGVRPPEPADVRAYAPPMLVYLALSGTLRLDPRVSVVSGFFAAAGAVLYATTYADRGPAILLVGIVLLSVWVASNATRVIRYSVLKAREEAILEAYVPEELPRQIVSQGGSERAGRVEEVTLLLCDLRSFTQLSQHMSPDGAVAFVNAYLELVCPPIAAAGGVIDKFMGDGVLAFFEGGGHASRALGAGRRILEAIEGASLPADGPVRVGVALHSGEVLVGTVGPRTRREYTVISDAVNTVARLEELNKTFRSSMIASALTIAEVGERERAGAEGPVEAQIRGRDEPVAVYVFGAALPLGDDRDVSSRVRRFVGRDTEEPAS